MVKLKIFTNKRTGQRTVILPKKQFNIEKKTPMFLDIKKVNIKFK